MLGVALAFGLTVFTMAYAIGPISGGHYNPAVTIGLASAGRFEPKAILPYIGAQLVGAIVGSAILATIASGTASFDLVGSGFAANGYEIHSPGGYMMQAGFVTELVLTFGFLMVIIGATDRLLCSAGDRARAHPDPSDRDPDHKHFGQSCA